MLGFRSSQGIIVYAIKDDNVIVDNFFHFYFVLEYSLLTMLW